MNDIVHELRSLAEILSKENTDSNAGLDQICIKAANEIERLRADVVLMRSLTHKAVNDGTGSFVEIKKEIRDGK